MKTVFINGSPKKKAGASDYLVCAQKFFVKSKKVVEKLRSRADHARILEQLKDADAVVFSLPLYFDGIPSHILAFFEEMEAFCKENNLSLKVYAISNGGFIEGKQNRCVLEIIENFCVRAGCTYGGGLGVGGGVMLHVMRLVFRLQIIILLARMLYGGFFQFDFMPLSALDSFLRSAVIIFLLNIGVYIFTFLMARSINKGKTTKNRYTRIMIPSFIFIPIAATFFFVFSLIKGGIFKGWLKRK